MMLKHRSNTCWGMGMWSKALDVLTHFGQAGYRRPRMMRRCRLSAATLVCSAERAMDDRKGRWPKLPRRLIERKIAKRDLRGAVVSISESGLKLMEVVAPSWEAIHAEIRRRYGANKLSRASGDAGGPGGES